MSEKGDCSQLESMRKIRGELDYPERLEVLKNDAQDLRECRLGRGLVHNVLAGKMDAVASAHCLFTVSRPAGKTQYLQQSTLVNITGGGCNGRKQCLYDLKLHTLIGLLSNKAISVCISYVRQVTLPNGVHNQVDQAHSVRKSFNLREHIPS